MNVRARHRYGRNALHEPKLLKKALQDFFASTSATVLYFFIEPLCIPKNAQVGCTA